MLSSQKCNVTNHGFALNIWLYLPHALMDFNQSWVIDATWEPSFVDVVKGHISRSKVI